MAKRRNFKKRNSKAVFKRKAGLVVSSITKLDGALSDSLSAKGCHDVNFDMSKLCFRRHGPKGKLEPILEELDKEIK
jgi:hypothetical protein